MPDRLSAVDQIIQDAQSDGAFDDLPGKGKPLALDTSPDAVVNSLLRNAGFTPEWGQLAVEMDRLMEQAEQLLAGYGPDHAAAVSALCAPPGAGQDTPSETGWTRVWQRRLRALLHGSAADALPPPEVLAAFQRRRENALSRYATLLHETNRKIRRYNALVPLANRQRALLPVRERLQAFAERFPSVAPGPEGGYRPVEEPVPERLLAPPEDGDDSRRERGLLRAEALAELRACGRKPPPLG